MLSYNFNPTFCESGARDRNLVDNFPKTTIQTADMSCVYDKLLGDAQQLT